MNFSLFLNPAYLNTTFIFTWQTKKPCKGPQNLSLITSFFSPFRRRKIRILARTTPRQIEEYTKGKDEKKKRRGGKRKEEEVDSSASFLCPSPSGL